MKLSLEEENQIFVPEDDDASKISFRKDHIPNHYYGTNKYDDTFIADILQKLFTICDIDQHDDQIIDVETVYNTIDDILQRNTSYFGTIFEKIVPGYNKKSNDIETK